ncbi:uncharacterized protein [Argopecten irradians]|uniref:uncharacterized protein n=1 Tax=Argopecten irradians TaxID=31199 RepID=UPI00370F8497
MLPDTYEARRVATIKALHVLLLTEDHVHVWSHRRLFNSPLDLFLHDGCHLNTTGNKKFYRRVRGCNCLCFVAENSSAPAPHPVPLEGIDIAALAAAVSNSVTEAVTTALQRLQSRPIATAPAPFALGSPSQDIQVGDSVRNSNATTTGEDSVTPRARAIPQGSTTEDVNNINSDFTSVVSGAAMNSATHMATGGFNSGDIAPPVSLACQPLYRRVSNDMREKINSGKFIDLASLLDDSGEQESYLRLDKSGFVQLPQPRKRFLDINKWTDAFSIYASVLRQHHPNLREPLATYQNVVRGIASNGGHWYFYDTNFRRMRESSPDLAWNQLFSGERKSQTCKNLKSALDNPQQVMVKLQKELDTERIKGPFSEPPFDDFKISPLGSLAGSRIQEIGTQNGYNTNHNTIQIPPREFSGGVEDHLNKSLSSSSRVTYSRAWATFSVFANNNHIIPDSSSVNSSHIACFISELHAKGFAPKTISTYVSAVAYVHKLLHNQDPTDSFLIKKLICGAYRASPSTDTRLPFDVDTLNKLLAALEFVATSPFELVLFRSMFLFAFNAFARVGEIADTGKQENLVHYENIMLSRSELTGNEEVVVHFYEFKHNLDKTRHTVTFGHGPTNHSAIKALTEYIVFRGTSAGPLYLYLNGKPVKRQHFDKTLHAALKYCNLDSRFYKEHSFRLGAASYAALQLHYSDAEIRTLGRWKSNAFKKYIRLPQS